jgi:hypothetical protein
VPDWGAKVGKVYLLTDPRHSLTFDQRADGLTIQLPQITPDRIATVIVLETIS